MDDVVGVLRTALRALDDSNDPHKDSLFVYALKQEIVRVMAHLESAKVQRMAVRPVPLSE
jgi:hypothetical protein